MWTSPFFKSLKQPMLYFSCNTTLLSYHKKGCIFMLCTLMNLLHKCKETRKRRDWREITEVEFLVSWTQTNTDTRSMLPFLVSLQLTSVQSVHWLFDGTRSKAAWCWSQTGKRGNSLKNGNLSRVSQNLQALLTCQRCQHHTSQRTDARKFQITSPGLSCAHTWVASMALFDLN